MVKKKQCRALIHLYDREIARHLEVLHREPEKAEGLTELLEEGRLEELIQQHPDSFEFAEKLLAELQKSLLAEADEERLYRNIMTFLNKNMRSSPVHRLLKCNNELVRKSGFHFILDNLDEFLAYTDPFQVVEHLGGLPQYDESAMALRDEVQRPENVDKKALMTKLVLRTVPVLGTASCYDLMDAVYNRATQNLQTEARMFIERILGLRQGAFNSFYQNLKNDRFQMNGKIVVCPIGESATEMMMILGTANLEANHRFKMIDLQFDNIPNVENESPTRIIIDSIRNRIHEQRPLHLREYQHELCKVALRGENTIVTAPTGSGKTVIAANIIKHHFSNGCGGSRKPKALFLTPNSIILKQQSDNISKYLDHVYLVQIIQGADNVPIREAIRSKDLIVATPQMIVNLCNEHQDGINAEQFYLSTFTLIIFDECHNTLKNTPYANIMREYHRLKNMGDMPDGHKLPQIVGLTASLGTGDAKNIVGVREHITELCASMDVRELSVVRDNLNELAAYSPIAPDKVCLCPRTEDGAIGTFSTRICQMMRDIEELAIRTIRVAGIRIHEASVSARNPDSRPPNVFSAAPDDKEHSGYLNWVCNQLKTVSETRFSCSSSKLRISEALVVLKECYQALNYNINFNPTVALNYLRREMDERSANFTPEMTEIWERYHHQLATNGTAENPMIARVEDYLLEQNAADAEFRAIIFMRTRYESKILKAILNENERLARHNIRTDDISGLNRSSSSDMDSASKRKQMEKLANFADGRTRVLVSTSVAEEGLDVAKCNLVIKYNYATNDIAHVQRRGRGRALNSTCVLITNSRALCDQENANKDKERMMKQTLAEIQERPALFEATVREKTSEIWQRILSEETMRRHQIQAQTRRNVAYSIICKKCDQVLCSHKDIRSRGTQYFVVLADFWSRAQAVQSTAAELVRDVKFHATGRIVCRGRNCGTVLGRMIEVATSTSLPCLAAESIVLDNGEQRYALRKWKKILSDHFTPGTLRDLDVQLMRNAEGNRRGALNFDVHHENGTIQNVIRNIEI